jgi:hypothetical protein
MLGGVPRFGQLPASSAMTEAYESSDEPLPQNILRSDYGEFRLFRRLRIIKKTMKPGTNGTTK